MGKVKNKNIFLIGPMGAGKSSVGKLLARELAMDFYDTDEEIEKRTGANLAWIFDLEGQEGLNKREALIIEDLTRLSNIVLATGGGSVIESSNQHALAARGAVIYLKVSLDYQKNRTIYDGRRPLLRVKNREEVLIKLMHELAPLYTKIADFQVVTDNRNVRAVVEDILQWLENV